MGFKLHVLGEVDQVSGRRARTAVGGGKDLDAARANADKVLERNPSIGAVTIVEEQPDEKRAGQVKYVDVETVER